jgi:hypothetical protein
MDLRAAAELLDPRTPVRLALASDPPALADYYRFGADYVLDVATAMGFETGTTAATVDRAEAAMRDGRTEVRVEVARSVASVLLGDANWWLPFGTWVPVHWAALSAFRAWPLFLNLRRVGHAYAGALDTFDVPTFSTRWDVFVAGRPAVAHVSGYEDRLLLADSVLHLEWFVAVAEDHGIDVPDDLVARTRHASVEFYTGYREDLPPDVRAFQYHLFADGEWIRRFAERYTGVVGIDERGIRAIERTRREDLQP